MSLLLAFLLAIPVSFAHQQKEALTRILFNPNTNNIEIMHRFALHDAEHAATLIFGQRQTLLESAESRQLFGSYVVNRFAIEAETADSTGAELPLQYVGEEVDGQYIWIYQETPQLPSITSLTVVNRALRDVWPDQYNLVNIEKDGAIKSMEFVGGADVLSTDI